MTERKPPGVPFESWVDKQIRDAEQRGEFDQLPGVGKPLPADLETPYDELWWIRRKMAREGLSVLPPTLALRKEAEDALAAAYAAPSERIVRKIITDVNVKLRDMMFKPPPGPPLGMKPYDVEAVVREWRERRAAAGKKTAGETTGGESTERTDP
ncbi:J-domain-containing protein [Streptomyces sp. IBSBF 2806]|uniref:DnaJ family domain-containing protein n=1 Tax=Streptomyces sp. IBSBF 2806 TaxID=2903529 RepID=UPI002FDC2D28